MTPLSKDTDLRPQPGNTYRLIRQVNMFYYAVPYPNNNLNDLDALFKGT